MATGSEETIANLKLGQTQSLYPPIDPYKVGYINVSDVHTVYFEVSGNPDGIPVCFIHGGPGGATVDAHRRFFNPKGKAFSSRQHVLRQYSFTE